MNINRDKHNKYVVNWTPTYPTSTADTSTGQTGSSTIIYVGGGSGTGGGTTTPTVEQEAFAYYSISDGINTIIQAASIPRDTAYLTIIGDDNINVTAVTESSIPEQEFVSTGTNTGTYTISYQKVVTIPEAPTEPEETEEPTEPVIPEPVTTYPLNIVYVSGDKIQTTQFDALRLYNVTVENEVETKTEIKSIALAELTVEGDTNGIQSITADVGNISFNRVEFTITTSTEVEGEQVTQTTAVLSFDVQILNKNTVYVKSNFDIEQYWKLDEDGNLYTDYNAYSTKELSAYGLGSSEENPEGGAQYLYQLQDVDKETAQTPADKGILQYNATKKLWEVTDGSDIKPDLTGYATTEWVTTQVNNYINQLKGDAPEDMDTLGEIAGVISNVQEKLASLEVLLEWFEWDDTNQAIKALFDLYGVGEISAYGYGSGETEPSASYLRELKDVDLTNLKDDGILQYNSSTQLWEVTDGSNLRPDLTGYATQSWVGTQISTAITNLIGGAPEEFDTLGEIAAVIQSLQQILDWFSFVDGKIRANYDLWGVGEISAYGVGEGSSSGGKNYLHELEDVSITPSSLTSGQLLQYNGSVWIAIDKDEVGLNETELASYLTRNNYLQEGDVTWSNLPGKPTTFDTTIAQITNLPDQWETLLTNSPTAYVTRWPQFSEVTNKPTTLEGYGITDAFTKTEADDRYVNITGDTMTGDLTLPNAIVTNTIKIGSIYITYDSTNDALKVYKSGDAQANLYATGEVTAYGAGSEAEGPGLDIDQLWEILGSNTTEQINVSHLTNALDGYATESWVTQQIEEYTPDLTGYVKSIYVNSSTYTPNSSGRVTLPDYITRYSVDSDGTQVISTNLRLKDSSNYGQYLYFGDGSYAYIAELTDDDLTIHASDLNLDVDRLLVNGEELALDINISNSGSGNIVTNITASGNSLTVTKGFTIGTGSTGKLAYYTGSTTIGSYSSTIGSTNSPVYINDGVPTAITYDLNGNLNAGVAGRLAYYSYSNAIDDYASTVGSSTRLWYLSSGVPTNSSSTVGSSTSPVYLSSGTITACTYDLSANVNSGTSGRLAYYSSSTAIDDYASTAGSSTRLWYLSSGTPTNSSSTIGSNYVPVFLSSGTITASSQEFMVNRGVLSDYWTNWNSALTAGMYSVSKWGTNGPSNAGYEYGTLAIFQSGSSSYGGAVSQLYMPHMNTGAGVYAAWRTTYQESSSKWTNWHYLLDTGNYAHFLNNYYVRKTGDNMTGTLSNTADFTAGGGFYLTSSHGRMIWDSGTSAMWLQSSSSGKMYLSGLNSTYLTNLQLYAKRTDIPAGALYITNTGYGNTLNLCRNEANTASMLTFSNSNGIVGYLGMSSTTSFPNWAKNTPSFGTSQSSNWMLHNSRDNVGMWAVHVDLRSLSDSNFYPFVWSTSRGYQSEIEVQITSASEIASAKWNQNHIHFIARSGGWSDNGSMLIILNHRFYQANEVTIGSIGFGTQNGTMCVWLRGGCSYDVYHTGVVSDTYHTSSYSIGGSRYTVGTNFYGGSNSNVLIQWSPTTSGVNNKMYINGGTITSVGSIVSQGEITAYSSSDIRFKTDIHNLTGLDYIRKMRPVEYDWTDEALELKANKVRHGYGLIAQELEQIIPDLVTHNMFNEGYLGIDYTRLVPFTISAIQEVDDEVTKLKKRVKELENKINKYEKLNRQRTAGINISDATICS